MKLFSNAPSRRRAPQHSLARSSAQQTGYRCSFRRTRSWRTRQQPSRAQHTQHLRFPIRAIIPHGVKQLTSCIRTRCSVRAPLPPAREPTDAARRAAVENEILPRLLLASAFRVFWLRSAFFALSSSVKAISSSLSAFCFIAPLPAMMHVAMAMKSTRKKTLLMMIPLERPQIQGLLQDGKTSKEAKQ